MGKVKEVVLALSRYKLSKMKLDNLTYGQLEVENWDKYLVY